MLSLIIYSDLLSMLGTRSDSFQVDTDRNDKTSQRQRNVHFDKVYSRVARTRLEPEASPGLIYGVLTFDNTGSPIVCNNILHFDRERTQDGRFDRQETDVRSIFHIVCR